MAIYGQFESDDEREAAVPGQHGMGTPIAAGRFYETYNGHHRCYLEEILVRLRDIHGEEPGGTPIPSTAIFLAGDSSLDNKTWLFNQGAPAEHWRPSQSHAQAINGYEQILRPPRMICDVTYWLNLILSDLGARAFAVNSAIEATTLASRVGGVQCCVCPALGGLYDQDQFILEQIRPSDMLVISVGGNDIALAPSIITVLALALLLLTPWPFLAVWHPAVAYFIGLFRYQVQCYAERLTARTRPAKIGVCMIYNLDESNGMSWANPALCLLCYFCFPGVLQRRMRLAFELGTSAVHIPGTEVVPIHLAEALDGKCSADYHQRVEPSVIGGQKMARLILHHLGWSCRTPGYRYGCDFESDSFSNLS